MMPKWCQNWCIINCPKSDLKMIKIGGVKIDPKIVKNDQICGGVKMTKIDVFRSPGPGPPRL
jgi:hypothetical protein